MHKTNIILAVATALSLTSLLVAQAPNWTKAAPAASAGWRQGHAMAYDSARGKTVMFGGDVYWRVSNETWEYDGKSWVSFSGTRPSIRTKHSLAYDSVRQKVILFGGSNFSSSVIYNDTWEYDGRDWTQVTTPQSPSGRLAHNMAYDSVRQRLVLFGGVAGSQTLGDTWEYDGVDWIQVTPASSPAGRYHHRMVYDMARGVVVMFGGTIGSSWTNETWEYDGQTWRRINVANVPSARTEHGMAYDSARQRVVMFGGRSGANETWEYDGVNWKAITTSVRPNGRRYSAIAYDSARQRVVMFGGMHGNGNPTDTDTWEFYGGPPYLLAGYNTFGASCGAKPPSLAPAPGSLPKFNANFDLVIGNLSTLQQGMLFIGASDTAWSGAALPLHLALIGMPGCSLYVSPDLVVPFSTGFNTHYTWSVAVPNQASLLGVNFYQQAFLLDVSANAAGLVVSNAGKGVIGY